MKRIWCNGQWLDPQDFLSSPMDRGSIHGLGLFETMLAIDGVLLFADRHLARLRSGYEKLGWPSEFPAIHEIAAGLLAENGLATGRARVRLTVTGGSGPIHDLTPGADRLVWLSAFPALVPPESLSACISPWPRNEHSPLVGLKCASYSENLIALDHARRMGFDETIFLNTAGHLCEAATANLFLVRNGTLLTPPLDSGCLPGITRELVIELAADTGIPCEVSNLTAGELEAADEVFLTSSTIGVLPVFRLGHRAIPTGPVTRRLRERLSEDRTADLQSARDAKSP
jgi:branched-subunit amino acid aminotransferase/4-amino-4-deoxychorismate lyase